MQARTYVALYLTVVFATLILIFKVNPAHASKKESQNSCKTVATTETILANAKAEELKFASDLINSLRKKDISGLKLMFHDNLRFTTSAAEMFFRALTLQNNKIKSWSIYRLWEMQVSKPGVAIDCDPHPVFGLMGPPQQFAADIRVQGTVETFKVVLHFFKEAKEQKFKITSWSLVQLTYLGQTIDDWMAPALGDAQTQKKDMTVNTPSIASIGRWIIATKLYAAHPHHYFPEVESMNPELHKWFTGFGSPSIAASKALAFLQSQLQGRVAGTLKDLSPTDVDIYFTSLKPSISISIAHPSASPRLKDCKDAQNRLVAESESLKKEFKYLRCFIRHKNSKGESLVAKFYSEF